MASRRDARVRRAATGEIGTVWSTPSAPADGIDAVAPATAAQSTPDTDTQAPVTRASRRIRTAPTPLQASSGASDDAAIPASAEPAAAIVESIAVAAAAAVADAAAPVDDEATASAPSPSSVPTAAIAWAAAAAAAAESQAPAVVEPVLAPAEPFELLEPAFDAPVTDEAPDETGEPARESTSQIDEFEAAARLFSFTGETPVQTEAADDAPVGSDETVGSEETEESAAQAQAAHTAPRRRARNVGRQLTTASFSVGVMGIVGLLTVGMTTPADAVAAVSGAEPTSLVAAEGAAPEVAAEDIQAYVAPGDIQNATLERSENYSTVSMGEIAAEQGISNYSNFFVNDPNAAIQWPFAVGVPITYGFGMRSGRMHEGADFVPGQGAEIQAIADGTVRIATNSGGAYGVSVVIDHVIDGQLVSSRYAHMLYGSLNVSVGQQVTVGTVLGKTGNTGRSYGAHTHFEILQGGTTAIDPIAWLRDNAGRSSLDSE